MKDPIVTRLIPQPKEILSKEGAFSWENPVKVIVEPGNKDDHYAASTLVETCCERGISVPAIHDFKEGENFGGSRVILAGDPCRHWALVKTMAEEGLSIPSEIADEGYLLCVTPRRILIIGNSPSGVYYGFQTLIQLLPEDRDGEIPALLIKDWPDLNTRGVSLDLARGEVSTPEAIKAEIRRFSHYKLNTLVLYLENAFLFPSHPDIGKDRDRLTTEEALDLDSYARKHHIMLVPSLDSPGHTERFLEDPNYSYLAEGHDMNFVKNVVDVTNPQTYPFLRDLYVDLCRAFPAPLHYLCGDEAFGLGKGKSKRIADEVGRHNLYIRHVKIISEILAEHGKRTAITGDPFEPGFFAAFGLPNYGLEALYQMPRNIIIVPWHYGPMPEFPVGDEIAKLGFQMHLWAWIGDCNGFFPQVGDSIRNIQSYVPHAHRLKALGALASSWGDRNSFREYNWPMFAFFSEWAWDSRARSSEELLPVAVERFYGQGTGCLSETLLFLGDVGRYFGWCVIGLGSPGFTMFYDPMEPRSLTDEQLQLLADFREDWRKAQTAYRDARGAASRHVGYLDFIEFALEQFKIMGDLVECRHLMAQPQPEEKQKFKVLLNRVAQVMPKLHERYQRLWHRSRRPRGLEPNSENFRKLEQSILSVLTTL